MVSEGTAGALKTRRIWSDSDSMAVRLDFDGLILHSNPNSIVVGWRKNCLDKANAGGFGSIPWYQWAGMSMGIKKLLGGGGNRAL